MSHLEGFGNILEIDVCWLRAKVRNNTARVTGRSLTQTTGRSCRSWWRLQNTSQLHYSQF